MILSIVKLTYKALTAQIMASPTVCPMSINSATKNITPLSIFAVLTVLFIVNSTPAYSAGSGDILFKAGASNSALEAQETDLPQEKTSTIIIADDYNRGSPRSAIKHYLNTARKGNYSQAIHYIDFSAANNKIRTMAKEDVAKLLKLVLDRSLWVDLPTLSNGTAGFMRDGIAGDRDLIGYIPLGDQEIPFYVQQVPREDGVLIWKIAGISINYLPELYKQYGDGPIGEILTQFIPHKSILGMQLWQWITFLGLIIAAIVLAWLPTTLLAWGIKKRDVHMGQQLADIISGPIFVLLAILLFRGGGTLFLSPSLGLVKVMSGYTLLIIAMAWSILMTLNILRDFFANKLIANDRKAAAKLLHPLTTMIKIILFVTAGLVWLDNLGFQASTILAGLGIGGLAFALAAQKSIENVIGGITLYISSPVKVGNFCRVGKYIGTIEEIGLRYTKIRTLDRTLVSISNAVFVDLNLENYSERNRIRYKPELVFSYKSTKEQINKTLVDIKQLLDDHENICEAPCRVRLANYLEHGYAINVISYVDTTRIAIYAEVSNELNLAILGILDNNGIKLADVSRSGLAKAQQDATESM
jgi:MscS family membrane protein